MKRVAAHLMALLLGVGCFQASAEGLDLSVMSREELLTYINACFSEIARRDLPDSEVAYENSELGISIRLNSIVLKHLNGVELQFAMTAVNDSQHDVRFSITDVAVNGWEGMWDDGCTVSAGKKTRATLQITRLDSYTDIASMNDAENIRLLEFKLAVSYEGFSEEIPYCFTDMSILNIKR